MKAISLTRHVAADPASVALILAGPSARDDTVLGDTGVLHVVAEQRANVSGVMVAAPRRNGVGFTASIDVSDGSGDTAHGVVLVSPSDDAGCDVRLTLGNVSESHASALGREARHFLDGLVKRARSRAYAA